MNKIETTIIILFLFLIGSSFVWAEPVTVKNVLDFNLTTSQDKMIEFSPPGVTIPYSLGINSDGDFIIIQEDEVKFRITQAGDVYITGSLATGTIPWASLVNIPSDCLAGTAVTGFVGDNFASSTLGL